MLSALVTPAKAGVQCLFCLALAGAGAGTAQARGDAAPHVRVVFDGIEPPIEGVQVQVYDDGHLAPQLVLDNRTSRPLEILDRRGRSVLRIRPQASWSGSDPRLDPAAVHIPDAAPPGPTALREWRVPARLGGQALELRGHFRYEPPATGGFVPRLTSARRLAAGVSVRLSADPAPSLLLENRSAEPVVVLGQEREPFLRISRAGVEANAASPTWQAFRHGQVTAARPGPARWERISTEPRYRWRDPRAGRPRPGEARRNWEVPVRIGGRSAAIRGVTEWQPAVY